jgi:hypothetical protein
MENKTNILFIIFLLIFAAVGYFWYSRISESAGEGTISISQEEIFGAEFLSSIKKLKTLEFDTAFFEDEEFQALQDLTPVIEVPEEVGRDNPFLPLD